jgi:hypothetical protein
MEEMNQFRIQYIRLFSKTVYRKVKQALFGVGTSVRGRI